MNQSEFTEKYIAVLERALHCSAKARREGLLALEDDLNNEKARKKDVFEYGLRLVIDGTDSVIIDQILSNLIAQEKDEHLHTLKTIQKEAVLRIQDGTNHQLLYLLLNSFTDIPLDEDKDMVDGV